MMKLSQFPRRDLERLSAYLDGALDQRETARLETRLRQEPELRQALQALRQTVGLLRSVPEVAPPRNFTLSPSMVAGPQRARAYPALQLATALVAAAFVFVIGLDLFGSTGMQTAMAPEAERMVAVEEAPAQVQVTEEVMKAAEAPEAADMVQTETALDNAAQEVEPRTGVPEPEAEALIITPEDEEPLAPPSPAEGEYRAEEPHATATPLPEGALGAAAPGTEAPQTSAGEDAEMEAPTEPEISFFDENGIEEPDEPVARSPLISGPLRYVEIGLGLALILLVVLTLSLRRQIS